MAVRHNLDEWLEGFETELPRIVAATTERTAAALRESLPAARVETRRAVFAAHRGQRGVIGLRFRQRYPVRGTDTERIWGQSWHRLRPQVRELFIRFFNRQISGK